MTQSGSPGHVSDEDVALYAMYPAGVDAAVVAHIAQCARCQQEAAQFERFSENLEEHLYRVKCPSAETLSAYAFERLAPEDQQQVVEHLKTCLRCAEDVRATQAFIAHSESDLIEWAAPAVGRESAQTPSADGQGTIRRLLGQLLPTPTEFSPAFPLLGSPDEQGSFQVFQAADLTISVQQEYSQGAHVITGIIHHENETASGEDALFVQLRRSDDGHTKVSSDQPTSQSNIARDTFEFDQVMPGNYQIEIYYPSLIVVVGPIAVKDDQ